MIARFSELLAEQRRRRKPLWSFTCYNLETATGVLLAAEERDEGVVLLVSPNSFSGPSGRLLMAGLVSAAERSAVKACVQLDHASDLALIQEAFELGAGAVMADGSRFPLRDNIAFVNRAADLADRSGAEVEAELGGIEGDEDVAAAVRAGGLTDPAEAARFVDESRPACLAVSIGNVHGRYREPPALDWERLEAIREKVKVPLSLHGASGLPEADLRRAIEAGITKVNVNTELREAYFAVTARAIGDLEAGARLLDLNAAQATEVSKVVGEKLDMHPGGTE